MIDTSNPLWQKWDAAAKKRDALYRELSALKGQYEFAEQVALDAQEKYFAAQRTINESPDSRIS